MTMTQKAQLMRIEQFIELSEGNWRSMRSGHSLAFQQFEQITSHIEISRLDLKEPDVVKLLEQSNTSQYKPVAPFRMSWEADSDWNMIEETENTSGSCVLIPVPSSIKKGLIVRSLGYAEAIQAISDYVLLSDGTLILKTNYENSIAEERIWFVSENVRCRSTVIKTSSGKGIIQTSFASEVRKINPKT